MVLWCCLKWNNECVVSGTSLEGLWCRPSSVTACALPQATWYELQSDMQMVVPCARLGAKKLRS